MTIYARIAAVVFVLLLAAATHWKALHSGLKMGRAEVQQKWDAERAQLERKHAQAQADARRAEQALQANADALRKKHRNEVATLNSRHAALVDSLRRRPERAAPAAPGATPAAAGVGAGCTGAQLARPDAEFLVGYAADAARLQVALNTCRAQYDAARGSLNQEGGPHARD